MSDSPDLERARQLAREVIELCDRIGRPLAATYMSMGLDKLNEPSEAPRIREPRRPWGRLN